MALYLTTGTPGAGKTLWTLWTVENRRIEDNAAFLKEALAQGKQPHEAREREVFYHNINVKNLPWIKLEKAEDWYGCPDGSIIVFDECQEAFPPRSTGSKVPEYVQLLAKSRHRGFDLYFITQHPSFTDSFVRKLPEFHNHLMRPFGAKMATVHSFKGVRDNVDKTRKDSITSKFSYPPEVFNWYKSAEVHTHKFRMPMKIWMMFLVPFLIAACAFGVWRYFDKKIHPDVPITKSSSSTSSSASAVQAKPKYEFNPASFRPRIDDLPWSAPRYDELTQPTIAPQIMGCVVFNNICKCLTQQGTTHHASMQFCLATLENGIFQDFDSAGKSSLRNEPSKDPQTSVRKADIQIPPVHQDSGFNLPVTPALERYKAGYTSHPSGSIAYSNLPSTSAIFLSQ